MHQAVHSVISNTDGEKDECNTFISSDLTRKNEQVSIEMYKFNNELNSSVYI